MGQRFLGHFTFGLEKFGEVSIGIMEVIRFSNSSLECEFHSILNVYLNNESLGMHGVNAAHITRFLPCIFIQDTENVDMTLHNNLI